MTDKENPMWKHFNSHNLYPNNTIPSLVMLYWLNTHETDRFTLEEED